MTARRLVVIALERACAALDLLPFGYRLTGYCQLARWAYTLDRRWGTGEWGVQDAEVQP